MLVQLFGIQTTSHSNEFITATSSWPLHSQQAGCSVDSSHINKIEIYELEVCVRAQVKPYDKNVNPSGPGGMMWGMCNAVWSQAQLALIIIMNHVTYHQGVLDRKMQLAL